MQRWFSWLDILNFSRRITNMFELTIVSLYQNFLFATALLYLISALNNYLVGRKRLLPYNTKPYVLLALAAAIYSLSVFMQFSEQMPRFYKIALGHVSWGAGVISMAFYISAIKEYLSIKSKIFVLIQRVLYAGVLYASICLLIYLGTGYPHLIFENKSLSIPSNIFLANSSYFHGFAKELILFSVFCIGVQIWVSIYFVRYILKKDFKEKMLLLGLSISAISVLTDLSMVVFPMKYIIPIFFVSNLVEILRFTFKAQVDLGQEILLLKGDLSESRRLLRLKDGEIVHLSKFSGSGLTVAQLLHDVINPISSIKMSREAISGELSSPDPDMQKVYDYLDICKNQVTFVSSLLASFRHFFSKEEVEVGEEFSLQDPIDLSLSVLAGKIKSYRMASSIELDCEKGLKLKGHEGHIVQAIMNLVSNSLDSVRGEKESWIKIKSYRDNDKIIIMIVDSGKGIEPQLRDKLFQEQISTKSQDDGTGFGLLIVGKIIQEHGGKVYFDSSSANTCVVIELPIA